MPDNMAPWDAIKYFATPVDSSLLVPGTITQILEGNPQRVALLFSAVAATCGVSPFGETAAGAFPILITSTNRPTLFTFRDHGVIVQMPWWVNAGVGQPLTVWQLILNDWPGEDQPVFMP